jgi:hypothetical protein
MQHSTSQFVNKEEHIDYVNFFHNNKYFHFSYEEYLISHYWEEKINI